MQELGLHYRLSKLAAGDCSFSMARTYDIEVWIPSMGIYKEVSSASNARAYQARRGAIRYRGEDGKPRFVHTLNASGLGHQPGDSGLGGAAPERGRIGHGAGGAPTLPWNRSPQPSEGMRLGRN